MPIVFNEPLSLLQRLAENIEYSELLEKADNSDDPIERIEVCVFKVILGFSFFFKFIIIKINNVLI